MSDSAWIGLAAILVSVALAGAGGVFALVGWFISRMITERDARLEAIDLEVTRLSRNVTIHHTVLSQKGYLPMIHRFPSPPPSESEETT